MSPNAPAGSSAALRPSRGEPQAALRIGRKAASPAAEAAEKNLIERVLAGEHELFYELVRRHEKSIYATSLAIVKNRSDAEDIAQDAVLKALANLHRFRKESRFSTWLTQITINEARMRLRKMRRRAHDSIDETIAGEDREYHPRDLADWREIPTEALERTELREALQRALAELPPLYRTVLVLRDVQNLSTIQTARALNVSVVAVKSRLLRARMHMREALAPGIDGAWSLGETHWRRVRPW